MDVGRDARTRIWSMSVWPVDSCCRYAGVGVVMRLVPISRRVLNDHTIIALPSAFRAVYRWTGRCFMQTLVYPGGRVMLPISRVYPNMDQAVRWRDRLPKSDALTSFLTRRAPDLRVGQVAEDRRASIAESFEYPC